MRELTQKMVDDFGRKEKCKLKNETENQCSTVGTTESPSYAGQPHEIFFMLFSRTLPLIHREYIFEGDAQHDAEMIARNNRGHVISIAKVIASVIEPLPALEWTDARPAGDGREHMTPRDLLRR